MLQPVQSEIKERDTAQFVTRSLVMVISGPVTGWS
jgi:hypothetical protein